MPATPVRIWTSRLRVEPATWAISSPTTACSTGVRPQRSDARRVAELPSATVTLGAPSIVASSRGSAQAPIPLATRSALVPAGGEVVAAAAGELPGAGLVAPPASAISCEGSLAASLVPPGPAALTSTRTR